MLEDLKEVLKPKHGEPLENDPKVLNYMSPLVLMSNIVRMFFICFAPSLYMNYVGVRNVLVNFSRYVVIKVPYKYKPIMYSVNFIVEFVKDMELGDHIEFVKYVVSMIQRKNNLSLLGFDLILG